MDDESILEEAQRLIHGPRQSAYGHPYDDFTRTGRMWGAILGIPDVAPEKVALCMAAVKLSREAHQHKRDNIVDGSGYLGTIELIVDRAASAPSVEASGTRTSTLTTTTRPGSSGDSCVPHATRSSA